MYMCIITIVIIKKLWLRGRAAVFAHRAVALLSLVVSIADVATDAAQPSGSAASAAQRVIILKCLATGAAQPSGGCVGVISTGAAQLSGEYVGDASNALAPEQPERVDVSAAPTQDATPATYPR